MSCHKCGSMDHYKRFCPKQGSRKFNRKIKCYDCGEMVFDIKVHRSSCEKSRRNKSIIRLNEQKSDTGEKKKNNVDTTDFYYLLDVSSSMSGYRLRTAKQSILNISMDMKNDDRMSIVSFDSKAFFKLKPRPVGQIRRQRELSDILDRIFARGMTAIYDAIWLAVSQIRDKNRKTMIIVLTDGDDNSSTHSYEDVLGLISEYSNINLNIINVGQDWNNQYFSLCDGRGDYVLIKETEIKTQIATTFKKIYR